MLFESSPSAARQAPRSFTLFAASFSVCKPLLYQNKSVQHLFLRNNNLKDEIGILFKEVCRFNATLITLDLAFNPINPRYLLMIKSKLAANAKLQVKEALPRLKETVARLQTAIPAVRLRQQRRRMVGAGDIAKKIEHAKTKLKEARALENQRTQELVAEKARLKQLHSELAATLSTCESELHVEHVRQAQTFKDLDHKLEGVSRTIKQLEQKRKH